MTATQEQAKPDYRRLFLSVLTPRTAPTHAVISHEDRNGPHVIGDDVEGLLLLGPLGVNYYIERADADVIYLRRWDVPA